MQITDLPTNDEDWGHGAWTEVFPSRPNSNGDRYPTEYGGIFSVYDGAQVEDITPERIARVDAWHATGGQMWAEQDMVALVELVDGSWAACTAWCDTSGWDCQSDVTWRWARTRDDAIRLGLDREGRNRLGVPLPSDVAATTP